MPREPSRLILVTLAAVAVLAFAVQAEARVLRTCGAGGDGKWFVTGGKNRAIWVIDTGTWQVVRRVWIGAWVEVVKFSHDSSHCAVLDHAFRLHIFETKTWRKIKTLKHISFVAFAAEAPVAATTDPKHSKQGETGVCVYSLPDWTLKKRLVYKNEKVHYFRDGVITPDGKKAYVCTNSYEGEEQKKAWREKPKDVPDAMWQELADGKSARIVELDLEAGKIGREFVRADTAGGYIGSLGRLRRMYLIGKRLVVPSYRGPMAIVDLEAGKYELKYLGREAQADGSGVSRSGEIYVGSLVQYHVFTPEGNRLTPRHGEKIERLPGNYGEYFVGFAPVGDKYVVGVTDACRLIVIDAKTRKFVKAVPVM